MLNTTKKMEQLEAPVGQLGLESKRALATFKRANLVAGWEGSQDQWQIRKRNQQVLTALEVKQ